MIAPGFAGVAAETPRRLRVLVAEDSLTIRKYLVRLLGSSPGFEVVGEATDGRQAVELCRTLRPDVVTMDMILPGVSGLAATEQIMAYCPTPILIVSASVNRGEVLQTYQALAAGAVDVLDKLRFHEPAAEWEHRFLAAVRLVARIKVITHPRARLAECPGASLPLPNALQPHGEAHDIGVIGLGASTGGPAAIAEILRALSPNFPVPILIVLHISELFAFAFAEWLNTLSPIPARYARDGEPLPRPGKPQLILAPAARHLVVEGGRLRLDDSPERNSCRPSIDVLFESMAHHRDLRALLCLLTGMGRDGAAGMLAGSRAGFDTVAQDEASSVIFGMPAEAIRLHAARQVLPLHEMAPYFNAVAGTPRPLAGVLREGQ